jgi:hypothetical protein
VDWGGADEVAVQPGVKGGNCCLPYQAHLKVAL